MCIPVPVPTTTVPVTVLPTVAVGWFFLIVAPGALLPGFLMRVCPLLVVPLLRGLMIMPSVFARVPGPGVPALMILRLPRGFRRRLRRQCITLASG